MNTTHIFRLICIWALAVIFLPMQAGAIGFGPAVNYAAGISPSNIAVADFNGDGKADVVVGNKGAGPNGPGISGTVQVLLNNGVGGLATPVSYTVSGLSSDITIADFNADGIPDMAVLIQGYVQAGLYNKLASVEVFTGDGTGAFAAAGVFQAGVHGTGITIADFNGDGIIDMAVSNKGTDSRAQSPQAGNVSVLIGDGAGGFGGAVNYALAPLVWNASKIASGDFNGDGNIDMVVGGIDSQNAKKTMNVFLNNGAGGFAAPIEHLVQGKITDVFVANLNNDGNDDMVAVTSLGVSTFLGDGAGGFSLPVGISASGISGLATDLNGDGNTDIVLGFFNVGVLIGDGAGGFTAPQLFLDDQTWHLYVASADFNGDGNSDVVVVNQKSNDVSVLLLDAVPPSGTITIDAGSALTNLPGVNLTLTCNDNISCTQMQFSNDNLTWNPLVPSATSSAWTLATGTDGVRTVYARFEDAGANVSTVVSDTIALDATAPVPPTITTPINNLFVTVSARPVISGTAETGAAVNVKDGTTSMGLVTATGGNWSLAPAAATLAEGVHSFNATATDVAGNASNASTIITYTVDTVPPTAVISSDFTTLKKGDVATLTFTLSEASTSFAIGDITVAGGALSGFSATSATVYTASFTPTASSTTGATVDVAGVTFTDAAGNNNAAASQLVIAVDTIVPALVISSDFTALKAGDVATLTFTLSESSTNFVVGDITVAGGALSGFSATSATVYTASFTPAASSSTAATVDVAAAVFTDATGNNNTAATQVTMSVDTIIPTLVIGSDFTALKIGDVATLTFTLSEASTDFVLGDITVAGGALSAFSAASATVYTASFTPTASSNVAATVDVLGAAFTDAAGNANKVATQLTMSVDTALPVLTINGTNPLTLEAGTTYTDAKAKMSDNVDAANVVLAGVSTVNTSVLGNYTVTYKYTDAAGNVATQVVRAVKVVDTTLPVIAGTPLADIKKEATGVKTPVTLIAPTATDLFAVNLTHNAPAGGFPVGTTVVVWTATDANGNVRIAKQNVIVSDTIVPVIAGTPMVDIKIEATANKSKITLKAPTATDLFAVTVTNNAPAAGFPVGATVVIWTATDANGLTSTTNQTVIVSDTTAPVISKLPLNVNVKGDPALGGRKDTNAIIAAFYIAATASDLVDGLVTITNDAPAFFKTGSRTVVTFTAIDVAGNSSTFTRTVTINDPAKVAASGTGLTVAQSKALGLDPNATTIDTDGDGIPDSVEIGDPANPYDNDGDGVIDAFEDSRSLLEGDQSIASGLPVDTGKMTISVVGQVLTKVKHTLIGKGAPKDVDFPYGVASYDTTSVKGASQVVTLKFTSPLPANLELYKVDAAGVYTMLPATAWKKVDAFSVEMTLTDGDPETDLDGVANGMIVDPVAVGGRPSPIAMISSGGIGGGCTLQGNKGGFDPMMPMLIMLSLLWMAFKRRAAIAVRGGSAFVAVFICLLMLNPQSSQADESNAMPWRIGMGAGAFQMSATYQGDPSKYKAVFPGYVVNVGYMVLPWLESGVLVSGGGSKTDTKVGNTVRLKLPVLPQLYVRARQSLSANWGLYEMISIGSLREEARKPSGAVVESDRSVALGFGAGISWKLDVHYMFDLGAFVPAVVLNSGNPALKTRQFGGVMSVNYAF